MAPRTPSSASTPAELHHQSNTNLKPASVTKFKSPTSHNTSNSGSRHSARIRNQIRDHTHALSVASDATSSQRTYNSTRRKFIADDEDDMPVAVIACKRRLQLSDDDADSPSLHTTGAPPPSTSLQIQQGVHDISLSSPLQPPVDTSQPPGAASVAPPPHSSSGPLAMCSTPPLAVAPPHVLPAPEYHPTAPTASNTQTRSPLIPINLRTNLWLTFAVHEMHALENGNLQHYDPRTDEELTAAGMPEAEIQELRHCRIAFPRVPQRLFPFQRPDTVDGDYLHFTQLPKHVKTNAQTHLSSSYQILIRFDTNYHNMTKEEVQLQAAERFQQMGISLATRYREPIIAMAGGKLKRWFGFLKVDLLNPETDGLSLLQGHRIFALTLQDGELTIGKIEKGYECPTTSINRCLQIHGPAVASRNTRELLAELIEAGYYSGHDLEIVGVSKPNRNSQTTIVTVTNNSSKRYLLAHPPHIQQEPVHVSNVAAETGDLDEPGAMTSTTIIVRNLPRQASKTLVTSALHKLLGVRNVLTVSYSNAQLDPNDRHNGIAFVTCLNTQVYTMWCRRKAVEFLGHYIDFEPHF